MQLKVNAGMTAAHEDVVDRSLEAQNAVDECHIHLNMCCINMKPGMIDLSG